MTGPGARNLLNLNISQQARRLREIPKMSSFVVISGPVENFEILIIPHHFPVAEGPRPPGGRPGRGSIHASKMVARMGSLPRFVSASISARNARFAAV
jgi:hypothetical protein